ncbi:MAG: small-conductance mechanosensitive channel [Myxococcota bacterium]|jgi:small-conductance mechanosensitive channel
MNWHPRPFLPLAALAGCALVSVLTLMAASSSVHAETLDDTLAEIAATMVEWEEHRSQTIGVKAISGLEAAAASRDEQFRARLKSLLIKKRSNREWKGYWEGEATFAGKLLAAYEQLAPVGAVGPIDARLTALELEQQAASRTRRQETIREQGIVDAGDAARDALAKVLADTRDGLPAQELAVVVGKAALSTASEPVARLEALSADTSADAEALSAARAALSAAVAERDAAAGALEAARGAKGDAEQLIAYLEPVLKGEPTTAVAPSGNAVITQRIETLLQLDQQLAQARTGLATATASDQVATDAVAAIETMRTGFRLRRPGLEAWAALARDKIINQDVYLTAINADIAAVETRLRGMADMPTDDNIGASAKVCDADRRHDQTPLEHHRECERVTREELRDLAAIMQDTAGANVLNDRGAESVGTLLEAQDTDLALVVREVAVSSAEERRATEAAESGPWRQIWVTYADRARSKKKQLADALHTTKDTVRTINVNRAFFASEQESQQQRIVTLETELEARTGTGRYVGALIESVWTFIRDAYMVPIYLLLAWLLLRLLGRAQRRIVESAKRKVEGRDAEQRVDTLAGVARGALKLIVYIAVILLCLEAMGVATGPILGGAAIFGLAISFGSQSLVKDFVTGFFILLENQYAVGDFVDIGGSSGTVEAITMRRTVLRDMAGKVHNIPNGAISSVINQTQGWSRVVMHLGVAYGTDLDLVEAVINRLGDEMYAEPVWADKLEEPPRYIGLTKFGDSDLTLRVMFKTLIFEQWEAERDFNRRTKDAFEAEGIEIPFPQRDVHLITMAPVPGA